MKKRFCAALLIAALLCGGAALAAAQVSGKLFSAAKQALQYLADGDYDRAAQALPFSGDAPDADEWARFARNFTQFDDVQHDYAVAYWADGWRVVVPLHPPASGSVEALMLLSDDGATFSGYKYVTWSRVEKEYAASDRVIWDQEYVGGSAKVYG